jgi:hypothetical protein
LLGQEILQSSISEEVRHSPHIKALRGEAKVSTPLPVYALSLQAALRPRPLKYVRLVGWNYLIVGGEATGIAHVHASRGKFRFAGITDGPAAQRLLDAALLAETALQGLRVSFEARVLEVPPLHIHALWLYRPNSSRFVQFDSTHHGIAELQSLDEMERRVFVALGAAE